MKKVPLAKKTAILSLGTRKMIRTLWRWNSKVLTIRKWCLEEKRKREKKEERRGKGCYGKYYDRRFVWPEAAELDQPGGRAFCAYLR